jgi:hypothetical protein
MPNERIQEILTEISARAPNSVIAKLTLELGVLLAQVATDEKQHTADTVAQLKAFNGMLAGLRNELRTLATSVEAREKVVSNKLHQQSNYMTGLEEKIHELAIMVQTNDTATQEKVINGH